MPHISVAFCLHNHQPAGNFDHIIEKAYWLAYGPFLDVLARRPEMKVVLHYSGVLLRWLDERRPEALEIVRRLVGEGRAELLTGGLYEPILPIIPERDQVGQIRALTEHIRERLGAEPRGMWLTERVWEPELVGPLKRAGVRYTIVDDSNFARAGVPEEESLGYFTAGGSEGESIDVFPINGALRHAIPFREPEAVVEELRRLAGEGNRLALFADDGEKLGEWPGTHERVYEEAWLERLFGLLAENREWVRVMTLSEFMAESPPAGRVELLPGSYSEMMEWSGGSWWNFLERYPESRLMHRKMVRVSEAVAGMEGSEEVAAEARDYLFRGQSNDPYWHGVFGGLYLLHLRTGNYRSLLKAENLARPGRGVEVERVDFDGDGREEVLVSSPRVNCYLHGIGGQIFELDDRRAAWNLLATLARRPEPYHEEGAGGDYDWYPRRALIDHFLREDTSLDGFAACRYGEQGDFVDQPYEAEADSRGDEVRVRFRREGGVWVGAELLPVTVAKELIFRGESEEIGVTYRLEQRGDRPLSLWFASELNFALSSGSGEGQRYELLGMERPPLAHRGSYEAVSEMALVDEWVGCRLGLRFERPADVWTFPVETLSQGLEGVERVFQGSCVTPHWRVDLRPKRPWTVGFRLSLEAVRAD